MPPFTNNRVPVTQEAIMFERFIERRERGAENRLFATG